MSFLDGARSAHLLALYFSVSKFLEECKGKGQGKPCPFLLYLRRVPLQLNTAVVLLDNLVKPVALNLLLVFK